MHVNILKIATIGTVTLCGGLSLVSAPAYSQETSSKPQDPVLISFERQDQLAVSAIRQRVLSQAMRFDLVVDESGRAIECEVSPRFRRRATEIALCRPMLKHMRFEPAKDARGEPVEGSYRLDMDFRMWMSRDGYLEDRFRN